MADRAKPIAINFQLNIMIKSKPANVDEVRTMQLIYGLCDISTLFTRWKQLESEGWKLFVVDQKRGRCYWDKLWITIPVWAITKPKGMSYWIYYIAHEFAHTAPQTHGAGMSDHGPEFMKEFKSLCPPEYWHYELGYMNKSATAAGITYENAGTGKHVQLTSLLDLL